jgi:putative tricarboxylic transport membrane protein
MIQWGEFVRGAEMLCSWGVPLAWVAGMLWGVIIAAIPGLPAGLGLALLVPFTFKMPLMPAILLLTSAYTGGAFGGAISAILINVPGSPAAIATPLDGYPMTQKGQPNEALGISLAASAIGGLFGILVLLLVMKPLSVLALAFGPPEMFMVAVFALTIIASLHESRFEKGMLAGLFGIMLGTMGMSSTGTVRNGFDILYLMEGMPVIPVLVGVFGFSELFSLMEKKYIIGGEVIVKRNMRKILEGFRMTLRYPVTLFRSSIIGVVIGALPAAGAAVAAVVSYTYAKRFSRHPETFGTGNPEGVVAAESADNASEGGALATMLALGVPGGQATAILIGAFMLQGVIPGPRLFFSRMDFVYGLIIAQFIEEIILIGVGLIVAYYLASVIEIPTRILVPLVAVFCTLGSLVLRNTIFDAYIMLFFGLLGWIMRKHGYPVVAVVLGIILGPIADGELIRTYQRFGGDLTVFFTRPISLVLVLLTILGLVFPYLIRRPTLPKTGDSSSIPKTT